MIANDVLPGKECALPFAEFARGGMAPVITLEAWLYETIDRVKIQP
jgi:hypothetical protein